MADSLTPFDLRRIHFSSKEKKEEAIELTKGWAENKIIYLLLEQNSLFTYREFLNTVNYLPEHLKEHIFFGPLVPLTLIGD